jgi:ubiquinone/menaquinone biosynthesis C-methylase UbiE
MIVMKEQNHKIQKYVHKKQGNVVAKKNQETSWSSVSSWYDELLSQDDTYQSQVIAPRLLRLVGDISGKKILDLACGQGYFARLLKEKGAIVYGSDISSLLIKKAKSMGDDIVYTIESADRLSYKNNSFDSIISVLAFQNIRDIAQVFSECSRVLTPEGKLIIVLNHPAFRVPKHSDWMFNEKTHTQVRTIDKYLSEAKIQITMHPGKKDGVETISFHRPLQYWFKVSAKAGFVVTRLEEWESHKESQNGPRKIAEDKARKEIPLFMAIVFEKK